MKKSKKDYKQEKIVNEDKHINLSNQNNNIIKAFLKDTHLHT